MRHLLILLLLPVALFAQSGGQPISIPISNPVLLGSGQPFVQDLGVSPAQLQALPANCCTDGIYTLQFTLQNYFSYPGEYPGELDVELDFGTQKLCEGYFWGIRAFVPITLTCPSPDYIVFDSALPSGPVQGQQHLFIKWQVNPDSFNPDWPLKFYNVSFTFTPVN